jgi:hypothetical protein
MTSDEDLYLTSLPHFNYGIKTQTRVKSRNQNVQKSRKARKSQVVLLRRKQQRLMQRQRTCARSEKDQWKRQIQAPPPLARRPNLHELAYQRANGALTEYACKLVKPQHRGQEHLVFPPVPESHLLEVLAGVYHPHEDRRILPLLLPELVHMIWQY